MGIVTDDDWDDDWDDHANEHWDQHRNQHRNSTERALGPALERAPGIRRGRPLVSHAVRSWPPSCAAAASGLPRSRPGCRPGCAAGPPGCAARKWPSWPGSVSPGTPGWSRAAPSTPACRSSARWPVHSAGPGRAGAPVPAGRRARRGERHWRPRGAAVQQVTPRCAGDHWTAWCRCPPACLTSASTCSPGTRRTPRSGPVWSAPRPASATSSGSASPTRSAATPTSTATTSCPRWSPSSGAPTAGTSGEPAWTGFVRGCRRSARISPGCGRSTMWPARSTYLKIFRHPAPTTGWP